MKETRISAALAGFMTPAEAAKIWYYNPNTGWLHWIDSPCNPIPAGSRAGSLSEEGYIRVTYQRHRYMAHWIIWALLKGEWPIGLIDHRDNNGANNRAENLRLASVERNMANRRRGPGVTNLRGAQYRSRDGTWVAICGRKYVGTFATEQAAHEAWKKAAVKRYGEFARFD